MKRRNTGRGETGFSLTELLVVLALMGILAAIGLPTMKTFYYGWRMKGTAQQISMMIQKARLRAVDTRANVTITFDASAAAVTRITYSEGWQGAGGSISSVYRAELMTIRKPLGVVGIGWDVGDNMGAPLIFTFGSDGTVSTSPAGNATNRPPRIDVYLGKAPTIVAPAYVRVSTRGSVYTGKLDLSLTSFSPLPLINSGYYTVTAADPHAEELRRGIKVVTTAQ